VNPGELDLRDIHLPEAPGWWPPAIGWWLLAALLAAAIVAAVLLWQRWRADRVRRAALAELEALAERCRSTPERLPAEVSVWLRRVALSVEPRAAVAGLTGPDWLAVLDRLSPGSTLAADWPRVLLDGPYAPSPDSAVEQQRLLAACRDWTRRLELER
jgi:hypothetical protein